MESDPHTPDTAALGGGDAADRRHLELAAAGDRVAFESLYMAYYGPLTRFVARLTGRADLVEETVNDVMFTVWNKAAGFRGESRVSTWILGIAYRQGLKAVRDAARRTRQLAAPAEPPADPRCPERELTRSELNTWIRAGLDNLPVEQRMVVELAFFGDHSYGEIAAIVGCPVNTVKTRMFHARRKLRRLMPGLSTGSGARYTDEIP